MHLLHAMNRDNPMKLNPLSLINKVDYTQSWFHKKSSFDIENSFTWLDWRIINKFEEPETGFSIEDIDQAQKLQLCFNILPNAQGMMHMLASSLKVDS